MTKWYANALFAKISIEGMANLTYYYNKVFPTYLWNEVMPKDIVIIMTELALPFLLVLGFLLYHALPEPFELIFGPCTMGLHTTHSCTHWLFKWNQGQSKTLTFSIEKVEKSVDIGSADNGILAFNSKFSKTLNFDINFANNFSKFYQSGIYQLWNWFYYKN